MTARAPESLSTRIFLRLVAFGRSRVTSARAAAKVENETPSASEDEAAQQSFSGPTLNDLDMLPVALLYRLAIFFLVASRGRCVEAPHAV